MVSEIGYMLKHHKLGLIFWCSGPDQETALRIKGEWNQQYKYNSEMRLKGRVVRVEVKELK